MDASAMPPPKQKMRTSATINRHVPAEMVEEILLNLPMKSLLRFSSVSKSWKSKIFESGFVKRHSAMPGRERIALVDSGSGKALSFLIPSDSLTVEATDLACPFGSGEYHVEASCKELGLVRSCESLYLWNPSMRNYKIVPKPRGREGEYFLGLGYEFKEDDYKILRIPYPERSDLFELYSLRSDSWTSIQDFPTNFLNYYGSPCVLVGGKLHWMAGPDVPNFEDDSAFAGAVISFDLSTEKFEELGLPMYFQVSLRVEEMSVLKGRLCMSVDGIVELDIWVMEEYGVVQSWTKKISIQCFNAIPPSEYELFIIRPLYFYENGNILIRVRDKTRRRRMFVYKGGKITRHEEGIRGSYQSNGDGFVYVDSLVAPSMWSQ